jgi:hypothetical protein
LRPEDENSPPYILNALKEGYEVEIDVWFENHKWLLGHDKPQYEVEIGFLQDPRLWCHAKNLAALTHMLKNDIHCFWHQEDDYTVTSHGHIWVYPGIPANTHSVIVCKSLEETEEHYRAEDVGGICSDFVGLL